MALHATELTPLPKRDTGVNEPNCQLSTTLSLKSAQYLEWLGAEAEARGGAHLSKAMVIRALLNVSMRLDIDTSFVTTQQELEERVWEALMRRVNAGG